MQDNNDWRVAYQVEVIDQTGIRDSNFYAKALELARKHGSEIWGNVDLTRQRMDANSFHLFYVLEKAEAFRSEVFATDLSRAVYVSKVGAKPNEPVQSLERMTDEQFRSLLLIGRTLHPLQVAATLDGYVEIGKDKPTVH